MGDENLWNTPNFGTLANLAATNLYNRRDYDRAVRYFQAYLESGEPSSRELAFEGLARCYFEQKQYGYAASLATQASQLYPSNLNILLIGIESAGYNGNDTEMESMLKLALRLQPDHRGLLEYQGKLYERMKQYENAAKSYSMLIQLAGNTLDYLTHLGFNYYNAATLSYRRAKTTDDQAELAKAQNLFFQAAPNLQTVLTNIPTAANVARALALCYSINNDGTKLKEANNTLRHMNVAQVDFNALPTLVRDYAPSSIIEQSTSNYTAQIASTGEEEIISDVDIDIPNTGLKNDNTLVLIIANEDYTEPNVPKVAFAKRDGETFGRYCEKVLGINRKNIYTRINASKSHMVSELKRLKEMTELKPGMNLIFYYAGHGMPDLLSEGSYLMPCDADGRDPEYMLSLAQIYNDFDSMQTKSTTVFLDACFSGTGRDGRPIYEGRYVARDAADLVSKGNTVVFSAGTGKEIANPYKEKGHGFFTYFLLDALKKSRGDISLEELGKHLSTEVAFNAKGILRADQHPMVKPSDGLGSEWKNRKLIDN